jgi:para-aminobenzoate synthetase component 1
MEKMNIVLKEIGTELNSAEVYLTFSNEENTIFLDSSLESESFGRYSFIGVNPFIVLKGSNDRCYLNGVEEKCNIFKKLSELLVKYKSENNTDMPFIGGCMGYLSYDYGVTMEGIKEVAVENLVLPHYYFVFYDNIIIFNNINGKTYVSACGILRSHNESIEIIEGRIFNSKKLENTEIKESKATFKSNFSREE